MLATADTTPAAAPPAPPRVRVKAGSSRAHMAAKSTSYTGASRTANNVTMWRPSLKSADADIFRDAPLLRARARDLRRNHPYAAQAVRASRLGVIGERLRYSCRPDWRFLGISQDEASHWGSEFERVWENYAHNEFFSIDAGRRLNFTTMMALLHDSDFVDGDSLAAWEWDESRPWRGCVQVIDVDRLSNPYGAPETRNLKGGVALNDFGAPVGYHIRNAHPAELGIVGMANATWSFIPAQTPWGRHVFRHGYEIERAGQTRGVTQFASVLIAMKQGAEYTDVALQQAILQASYAAVLVSQQNYADALEIVAGGDPTKAGDIVALAEENLAAALEYHEKIQLRFQGSQVPILWPGEDLKILNPGTGAANIGEFQKEATKSYAAGTGTDPIQVGQDYSQVNYSSAKMAAATSFRHYAMRRNRLIDTFAFPMVSNFLEEIVHSGAFWLPKGIKPGDFYIVRQALTRGKFLTQGAPMLDPVKERQGQLIGLQMGAETLQDIAAEDGRDYLEVLDQQARELAERAARGLPPPMGMMPPPMPGEDPAGDGGDTEDPPATDKTDGGA